MQARRRRTRGGAASAIDTDSVKPPLYEERKNSAESSARKDSGESLASSRKDSHGTGTSRGASSGDDASVSSPAETRGAASTPGKGAAIKKSDSAGSFTSSRGASRGTSPTSRTRDSGGRALDVLAETLNSEWSGMAFEFYLFVFYF